MHHESVTGTLHEQVAEALERGARAQEQSRALLEHHLTVEAAVHETVAGIHRRRERDGGASRQQ